MASDVLVATRPKAESGDCPGHWPDELRPDGTGGRGGHCVKKPSTEVRVAIVGSRDFAELDRVREYVNALPDGTVVVSGAARGVDRVPAETARARGLRVYEFPAEWRRWGLGAGYLRNRDIVAIADRVVAFWDGSSRGTAHTINLAERQGKPVEVIRSPR